MTHNHRSTILWVCHLMHTQKSCSISCDKTVLCLCRLFFSFPLSPEGWPLLMHVQKRVDYLYLFITYVLFCIVFDELILFKDAGNFIISLLECVLQPQSVARGMSNNVNLCWYFLTTRMTFEHLIKLGLCIHSRKNLI